MTDNTDSENEEPIPEAGRAYPDTLLITVKSNEEMTDDVLEKFENAIASESATATDEAVRAFEKVSEVRELLTDRRVEVLRAIRSEHPESISELAELLDRAYSLVNTDVQRLANYDIVHFRAGPHGAKQPYVPYNEVRIDISLLSGDDQSEFLIPKSKEKLEIEREWLEHAEDPRKLSS